MAVGRSLGRLTSWCKAFPAKLEVHFLFFRFRRSGGRFATWEDSLIHCTPPRLSAVVLLEHTWAREALFVSQFAARYWPVAAWPLRYPPGRWESPTPLFGRCSIFRSPPLTE